MPTPLVSRSRNSLTITSQGSRDLVRGFGPHEGLRVLVGDLEIVPDRRFELAGAAVRAPANRALGEQSEPALDLVEPGGAGRREVQVVAGPLEQPTMDRGRLVGAVVVEDQMDVEIGRDIGVDRVEEGAELLGPVALVTLADDLAGRHVQGREERG